MINNTIPYSTHTRSTSLYHTLTTYFISNIFYLYKRMSEFKTLIGYNQKPTQLTIKNGLIQYKGFDPISYDELIAFKNDIDKTLTEYVYPKVFTSRFKSVYIPEDRLYKLRLWANIYRYYKNTHDDNYNLYYIYRLYIKTRIFCENQ